MWPDQDDASGHEPLLRVAPGAIDVTGVAQERAWEIGLLPGVELVRPGLWSIPLPMATTRYVIVYAIELANGLALVDAGWDSDEAWKILTDGLQIIGGSIEDVEAVLVTHLHRDHYGLAGRIRDASGATVSLHRADAEVVENNRNDNGERVASARRLMVRCGLPATDVDEVLDAFSRMVPTSTVPDILLDHGDRAPIAGLDLEVIWTPGHSPGHVCFYEQQRRLLFAGDHLLPRITPNVSIHLDREMNPLADFLDSLATVRTIDADEILPAHEFRFRGLEVRVDELVAHHEARLEAIERFVESAPASSVWQIAQALPWSRPWAALPHHVRRSAVGETLAHIVLLELRERLRRDSSGDAWRFFRP